MRLQCAYSFSKATKEVFSVRGVAFSKYATSYGLLPCFSYCNLTISIERTSLSTTGDAQTRSVGLSPFNLRQYPVFYVDFYISKYNNYMNCFDCVVCFAFHFIKGYLYYMRSIFSLKVSQLYMYVQKK